ncbi:hypothetical protein ZIOFF_035586 [Zingiber officinale]|uniref:SPX domain-containing protein n=1 Tax=Zingiber officinale TaxID=94328 RepID=A0A8J5L767_ZINOF|nr:hypothetical protein ZIOFF_035586 [Zingiber officinale]
MDGKGVEEVMDTLLASGMKKIVADMAAADMDADMAAADMAADNMEEVNDGGVKDACRYALMRWFFLESEEDGGVEEMEAAARASGVEKGLVKILKKYDKRTGALIRQPFIEKVLQQPFFTTDLLYKLVKECVAMLDHLFPSNNLSISTECDGQNGVQKPAQSGGRVPELEEIKYMQSLYMKSTIAVLRSLKHIRSKSSTVKTD